MVCILTPPEVHCDIMTDRDVLWITLESARQDHTSFSDFGRDTTPSLTRLGMRGQYFEQCFAHDIWTRSSSASILTGLAPSAHQTWSNDAKLPETARTIPEAFLDAGYHTACISPNGQLSPSTGLDRGFEDFHYLIRSTLVSEAGFGALLRWLLAFRQHTGGATTDGSQHCIGYLTNQIAKRQIRQTAQTDDPLFLYVHHGDSHHAYVPPLAWRDRYESDLPMPVDEAVDVALRMSRDLHAYIAKENPFTIEEWQALQVLYDTTLAYVDHLTGQLIAYAREHLSDPIIVVTGDHGELFGEQGILAHMLLTNTAVSNVPLVVDGLAGPIPQGLIQHADVMQMLCSDLGIDHEVPVGQDVRVDPREMAVVQRGGVRARHKLATISNHNPAFPTQQFHSNDLTSVRTTEWRYQASESGSELYALPDETTDVSADNPEVVSNFEDALREWHATYGRPVGDVGRAEFDDETQAHLRDLGYLQ